MTIQELKDRIYQDFITSFKNAITPLRASFFDQLSNTLASTFHLVYIYLNNIIKDSFLTSCTKNRVLTYFAPLKNIIRKNATKANGILRFTGNNGEIIPINTKVIYNELEYQTTEEVTILSGFADAEAESIETGTVNNTLGNIDLFLIIPITGIDNKAISTAGFTGAIDQETVESVRTRTKQKFAAPTQLDNDNTYKSLALEISNVKASFISSVKNGPGTFGVTILTQSNNGIPIQADINEVQQYFIDNNAVPSYAEAEYFLPTIVSQNFSILLAENTPEKQAETEQLTRDYIYLFQKPNTTFQFEGLADILQQNGARLNFPDPTSDIALADDEVLDVGTMTWI